MKTPNATLAILPAGRHTANDGRAFEFTDAVLAEIVATYDPALHEAPLVIGHPQLDTPAYGWAKSLQVRDGMLYAEPHQVVPEFAEAANRQMYKKRSASVYLPDSPGNPTPGRHYLRHIGFLGAAPPAIKGIPDHTVQFNEADAGAVVEFAEPDSRSDSRQDLTLLQRLRDWLADSPLPQPLILPHATEFAEGAEADAQTDTPPATAGDSSSDDSTEDTKTMDPNKPKDPKAAGADDDAAKATAESQADREAALNQREADIAAREKAAETQATAAQRAEVAEFAENLVKEGKLLPRQKEPVVELMLSLPADSAPLEFAEGDTTVTRPAAKVLRELLGSLPKAVDFAEKSGDKSGKGPEELTAQGIAAKARAYQAEQKALGNHITTAQAVRHVSKGASA